MSKKFLQSILIIGVLSIWGMVAYKILHNNDSNTNTKSPITSILDKKSHTQEENYVLNLNYEDPFLKQQSLEQKPHSRPVHHSPSRSKESDKHKKKEPKPSTPPAIQWPDIQYKGIIENQRKGLTLGIISIKGNDQIVRSNDVIGEFSILSLDKNQLIVKCSTGESKTYQKL